MTSGKKALEEYICNSESTPIQESEKLSSNGLGLKRHSCVPSKNAASVAKRNARERRRIQNVNKAFDELRQHVPVGGQNKKISKVSIFI